VTGAPHARSEQSVKYRPLNSSGIDFRSNGSAAPSLTVSAPVRTTRVPSTR
jgi:hypothetical protein